MKILFNHIWKSYIAAKIGIVLCILFCIIQSSIAQSSRTIYMSIIYVDSTTKPMVAAAYSAYTPVLKVLQKGEVTTRANKELNEDFDEKIGAATVVQVEDSNGLVILAIIPNTHGKSRGIKIGDLIAIDVEEHLFDPKHLIAHILPLQLKLLDQYRSPFFKEHALSKAYIKNPKAAEAWLLDTLYTDLKNFYLDSKDMLAGETFTKPFPKGRYKGKNVQQIFEHLTREDVANFFWFMSSFPGKYIGVEYKINETFATWLINDAPYGGCEVLNLYSAVKGDSSAFLQKLQAQQDLLSTEGISSSAALAANSMGYYSAGLADSMYRATIIFSQASKDFEGAGLVYLFTAENLHNSEKYAESLVYCQKAEIIFKDLSNYDRLLDLCFKQSYIFYTTSQYESSFKVLQMALQIIKTKADKLEDYTVAEAMSKYYDYTVFTYYKAGKYTDALLYIDTALAAPHPEENNKSLTSLGYLYNLQGKILKSQSLYDKALTAYNLAKSYYKKVADLKTATMMSNEVGVIYFRQGKYQESTTLLLDNIKTFEVASDLDNAGYAYSQIGQNYWNLYKYDSAIIMHNTAIDYRRRTGNKSGQAFSWEQLGTLYQKAGLKPKALAALDSAANLYEMTGEKAELAEVLLAAGIVYKNDKEDDKAELYYKKASNTLASLGNNAGYADALFELGLLLFKNKPEQAEIYMDSCRLMSIKAGLKAQTAYAIMNLGSLNKNKGKLAISKKWFADAKAIINQINEPHATAQYYRNLGFDAETEINLDSAINCYQKALVIFDSTDKAMALQMRSYIAGNYQNMGMYTAAETLLDTVLAQSRRGGYLLELGGASQSKGWMLLQQGQTKAGMALADTAAFYYQLSGNNNSLASIYGLRGDFYRNMYNFGEAFNWYTKSDSIYRAEKNPWGRSNALANFLVLYYYQGDYRTSLDYTYKAIAARPFIVEDQMYIDLQAALAENYYYLGKGDSCNTILQKYLPMAKAKKLVRTNNWLSLMQGRQWVDDNKFQQAIPYLKEATTVESAKNDLIIYQQALAYLGKAYAGIGKKDSAQVYFNQAVQVAHTFELPSFGWEALYLAGLNAYNTADYTTAINLFKESVALVNRQATNLYGGEEAGKMFKSHPQKADLYFKLMSSLTKAGRNDEAWQYANLSQAAAISDLAGGLGAEMQNTDKKEVLQEAQEKYQQLQSVSSALNQSKKDSLGKAGQIAVLEKTKAIAEEDYLNYIGQLKKDFPELGTFFANQVNPENFRNLHTYLPEDMAMLMYVVNDNELLIFWATAEKTGIQIQTIPPNFYNTTEAWIHALKTPSRPAGAGPLVLRTKIGKVQNNSKPTITVKDGAQQLYNMLIQPVINEIGAKESWCIIPNGKLTHLPFHVLGTANPSGNFEYLAASKNIFYTNKPNEMFMPWNRRNKASFAAFGNPDKSLASAGEEVKQIANTLKSSNIYLEDSATALKAANSLSTMQYVHFATHGVLTYPDFDSSYLVFAPQPGFPNGGKLTLYDIRSLNIKGCDLVTLSACETAVSAEISKGWYVSPANAFLINKVRSVVASLWEVDDKSTSLLMQQFYTHLQTMPKSIALRKAMADVSAMPEFEHPFYWAAFVLYGDWQ